MRSMTSQGTAHGRFTRAIANGNLRSAEMAARELGRLALADALALTALLALQESDRFDRAAVRWHGRFALETRGLSLDESQLALAAVAALHGPAAASAAETLASLGARYRLQLAPALRPLRSSG